MYPISHLLGMCHKLALFHLIHLKLEFHPFFYIIFNTVIGWIEAKVTLAPLLLKTSIIETVSISSQPSDAGTNTVNS